jgi:AcrR family transcriptional regulator
MATIQEITENYIDYVLTHGEQPKSVYNYSKSLGISESEFYQLFASFDAIERAIWSATIVETIDTIRQQEVWSTYTSREKMLSFFYSYVEVLKQQRSFVKYSLKDSGKFSTPAVLTDVRSVFENFAEELINEGLSSGELAERKFISKRYKDALWLQFAFIINFWMNDDSKDFEKTDEAIEKGINVTFDLFQHSPIDNLIEYGKFVSRNFDLKEKMGFK